MTHHVGVGVVHDDQVVRARADGRDQRVGHAAGAHLRGLVVGPHLGAGLHVPGLAAQGRLGAAVEEEGHVRILFRLRKAKLRHPGPRHHLAQRVGDVLVGEEHVHPCVVRRRVADHPGGRREREVAAREGVEARARDGVEQLAGAVGAEVDHEHAVAVAHPGMALDDGGGDELVAFAPRSGGLQRGLGAGGELAPRLYDGGMGGLHPVPAVVAVHRVEAARDCRDADALHAVEPRAQGGERRRHAARRHVAPVGEEMQRHRHARLRDGPRRGHDVPLVRVHAAGAQQAHDVARPAALAQRFDMCQQRGRAGEAAFGDGPVNPGQVHPHHAARADVGMAHLRVADLARGQAHVLAARLQRRGGHGGGEPVERGRARQPDRVALLLVAQAEAVEDDERDGTRLGHRAGPRGVVGTHHRHRPAMVNECLPGRGQAR